MSTIRDVVAVVREHPAPVIFVDTCTLLDLFRRDDKERQPRVPVEEVEAAADLLQLADAGPGLVHLVVPELVPGEFIDHADRIAGVLESWVRSVDDSQEWLGRVAALVGLTPAAVVCLHDLGVHARLRTLADELLAAAVVLDRDPACLERTIARLVGKRRPSHKKEVKDSMNLEQYLEVSRRLSGLSPPVARVFVSSNTNDFATAPTSTDLHPELQADFSSASLEYFTSLRRAVRLLRDRRQLS